LLFVHQDLNKNTIFHDVDSNGGVNLLSITNFKLAEDKKKLVETSFIEKRNNLNKLILATTTCLEQTTGSDTIIADP